MALLNPFHPKLFALVAIILAFPPVFTNFGKTEGLRLSLSLFTYYGLRGLLEFLFSFLEPGRSMYNFLQTMNRIFHFGEVPSALAAIYFGLQHIPDWIIRPYESLLLSISPVVTILEGLASMIIITTSGQGLTAFLEGRSDFLQIFFGLLCLAIYLVSSMVIFSLYYSEEIKTLVTASLVSCALTLVGVLTMGTVMLEHGVITDAALVFLYITYNIWTLVKDEAVQQPVTYQTNNLFNYLTNKFSWSAPSHESLVSIIGALFKMFSIELLASLFIQISVLLMASKIIDRSDDPDEIKTVRTFSFREWLFNVIWPCFGKPILILIYTYAWLTQGLSAQVPWYIQPKLWRWINIFFCLTIYMKHLLTPADDELASIWPDK